MCNKNEKNLKKIKSFFLEHCSVFFQGLLFWIISTAKWQNWRRIKLFLWAKTVECKPAQYFESSLYRTSNVCNMPVGNASSNPTNILSWTNGCEESRYQLQGMGLPLLTAGFPSGSWMQPTWCPREYEGKDQPLWRSSSQVQDEGWGGINLRLWVVIDLNYANDCIGVN